MIAQQLPSRVAERFDGESDVWDNIHSGAVQDIIQWEIAKRKAIARKFILRHYQDKPAAVLEVGCGAGRNLEEILSGNLNWTGKGVDIAPAMIKSCRERYGNDKRLTFEVFDIENGHLDEMFDVIVLLGVVGYLDSNATAFRNVQRMLRPGGFVIFTFGKGFSVSRLFRSAMRIAKNLLRWICHWGRRQSEPNLFRCYTLSQITADFPKEWRLTSHRNLVFGAGIFGRLSVCISKVFERIFTGWDPCRLALTSLVVVVNDRGDGSGAIR